MSGSVNKVILVGNIGDKPKLHRFDDSSVIVRFPLATSETYIKKGTNERIDQTEWHTVVVRNRLGEICDKYLNKGDKVFVEGKIKSRKWEDDKGNTRYTVEIIADNVKFLQLKKTDTQPFSEDDEHEQEGKDLPF